MGIVAALALLLDQPLEEAIGGLNVRVDVDPITGHHEFSGSSHRLKIAPGLRHMLLDGSLVALEEPARIHDGRLILPREVASMLPRLFAPLEPPPPPAPKPTAKPAPRRSGFKVVLDPGHGGIHTGAKGHSGKLFEKDVALDITRRLNDLLREIGIEPVLTRESDRHFAQNIHEDLQHRVDIATRHRADLFVSIHLNWSENSSARGFEVYVPRSSPHRTECDRAAQMVHAQLERRLDTPDRGIKEAGFYVLRHATCPSVLVELEFLSNPQGERAMMAKDHRQLVAEILRDAIVNYARARGY
jgi:N-acetylmuramoyl-L-alanine amidase